MPWPELPTIVTANERSLSSFRRGAIGSTVVGSLPPVPPAPSSHLNSQVPVTLSITNMVSIPTSYQLRTIILTLKRGEHVNDPPAYLVILESNPVHSRLK